MRYQRNYGLDAPYNLSLIFHHAVLFIPVFSQFFGYFYPTEYLNFYDNKLTGTIPKNLKLRDLYYFDIGRNFIGGSIPEDVGTDFIKLRYLHIDHNRLTETIPETIPPMADGRLISFLANHNRLEGLVPDNWTMINKCTYVSLYASYSKTIFCNKRYRVC